MKIITAVLYSCATVRTYIQAGLWQIERESNAFLSTLLEKYGRPMRFGASTGSMQIDVRVRIVCV